MTDGIIQKIQKVINKWFESNLLPNGVLTHELTYTDILILTGKLIEEIKKDFPEYNDNGVCEKLTTANKQFREYLIGDNEE